MDHKKQKDIHGDMNDDGENLMNTQLKICVTHHRERKVTLAISNGIINNTRVLRHRGSLVNETRIGRGILRRELFDGIDVARVANDGG